MIILYVYHENTIYLPWVIPDIRIHAVFDEGLADIGVAP